MALRQSGPVAARLPAIWLVTDARTEAALDGAILRLPRGSGVIFRHYHLGEEARRRRFAELRRLCCRKGHRLVLAGSARQARRWRADGCYGPPGAQVTVAAVHSLAELARAGRCGAQAVLLSPLFPTRSHPDGRTLGAVRFLLLARRSLLPVIALGGMTAARARALGVRRWAAIDALAGPRLWPRGLNPPNLGRRRPRRD